MATRTRRAAPGRRSSPSTSRRRAAPRQVGYAVIGLGHIAQESILPAFQNARKNSRLVALCSSNGDKLKKLGKRYGVDALYTYEQLDACLAHPDVDAVYITLPNEQHAEYTERCARAGVHVLCEKPMALTEAECERMIRAARESDVKLMVAYRLHYEPANLAAVEVVRKGRLGKPRAYSSVFGFQVKEGNIRTSAEHGGGPLWDIGIYCLNAARYLFGAEPEEVFAYNVPGRGGDARFAEVPEATVAVLRFPEGQVAQFTCSFNSAGTGSFQLVGEKGELRMENAFSYSGPKQLSVTVKGKTQRRRFREVDQFGPELLEFSRCIQENREPEPGGREGLADVRILRAIERSAAQGRPVRLEPFTRRARPGPEQAYDMSPVEPPGLEQVEAPH